MLLNSIIASEHGPSIMRLIPGEHKNKLKKVIEPQSPIKPDPEDDKKHTTTIKDTQELYPRKKKKTKITNFPE